ILAKLRAPAFLALKRGASHSFGDGEEVAQIERGVPAGIELAVAIYARLGCSFPERSNFFERLLHFIFLPNDANVVLHQLLQIPLHLIGTFGIRSSALKRFERVPGGCFNLSR